MSSFWPLGWPNATVVSGDAVDVVARLEEESEVPLRSHGCLSLKLFAKATGVKPALFSANFEGIGFLLRLARARWRVMSPLGMAARFEVRVCDRGVRHDTLGSRMGKTTRSGKQCATSDMCAAYQFAMGPFGRAG